MYSETKKTHFMDKQQDLRVIRTKASIKKAMFDLLNEKPFEKITVRDIAKSAMINRATFYLHYLDKYDLIDNIELDVLNEMNDAMAYITEKSIRTAINSGGPLPHILPILEYIENNGSFFTLIDNNNRNYIFYNKLVGKFSQKIVKIMGITPETALYEYKKEMGIAAASSVLSEWVRKKMADPKEDIASLITTTIMLFICSPSS